LGDEGFGSQSPPSRDGPQDHLFSHFNGEGVDEGAGKIGALMAALVSFALDAVPVMASLAEGRPKIALAAVAGDFFGPAAIHGGQPLLEFPVVVPMGDIYAANTAVQAAGSHQPGIHHGFSPFPPGMGRGFSPLINRLDRADRVAEPGWFLEKK
jgi:hypothetical protein